jgi:pyridoxal/pyridoxine/pyridoxamine kinase
MGFTWESFGIGPLETRYRIWFIKRLQKEIEKSQNGTGDRVTAENIDKIGIPEGIPTKALNHNTSDIRGIMNKVRNFPIHSRMNRPMSNF